MGPARNDTSGVTGHANKSSQRTRKKRGPLNSALGDLDNAR